MTKQELLNRLDELVNQLNKRAEITFLETEAVGDDFYWNICAVESNAFGITICNGLAKENNYRMAKGFSKPQIQLWVQQLAHQLRKQKGEI